MKYLMLATSLMVLLMLGSYHSGKPEPLQRVVLVDKICAFGRRDMEPEGPEPISYDLPAQTVRRPGLFSRVVTHLSQMLKRSLPG